MVTSNNLLAEREQIGEQRGYQRGVLRVLTQFVKMKWGDAVAAVSVLTTETF